MLIPLFALAAIVGTIAIAVYGNQPWLGFWEHLGDASHDTKHKAK